MKTINRSKFIAVFLIVVMSFAFYPSVSTASLSAGLGATDLHGLTDFANCQNQSIGYREGLIGDRLELKLANTGNLDLNERAFYIAEINALKVSRAMKKAYVPPDPKNSQHYMLGLSDNEQVAINSMNSRYVQEINLKCEQMYGGMTRYSSQADLSGQHAYENSLRGSMGTPIDINTIPVGPIEKEKTSAEREAEDNARLKQIQQVAMDRYMQCAQNLKGMRPKLVAQALQKKLDSSPNLSVKERAEIQEDITAAYVSAGKGLDMIESADPKNPMRAEMRLSPQEQQDLNLQFSTQYAQASQGCMPTPGATAFAALQQQRQ